MCICLLYDENGQIRTVMHHNTLSFTQCTHVVYTAGTSQTIEGKHESSYALCRGSLLELLFCDGVVRPLLSSYCTYPCNVKYLFRHEDLGITQERTWMASRKLESTS